MLIIVSAAAGCGGDGGGADLAAGGDLAVGGSADLSASTGGPSLCGGGGFRVCDGFEAAAIDKTIWPLVITNGATVTLDATHVARGAQALHVHTAGVTAGTNGGLRTMQGFPFPNDDLWGRVFVYMAGASPDQHTNMVEAVGPLTVDGGTTDAHYRLGVSTAHVIAGNYIPGDYADHSATTMPLDRWACFEWHYDGAHDEYHVFVDGSELGDMAITTTHVPKWTAPSFAYLELGLHLYHTLTDVPPLDVWYDELALDGARIGCAR
ncbi:MAG TPA: hypothetical protein VHB97_25935 [Polyangia bacterium]|nr:hypothetical protein [Polyangia bacterium]